VPRCSMLLAKIPLGYRNSVQHVLHTIPPLIRDEQRSTSTSRHHPTNPQPDGDFRGPDTGLLEPDDLTRLTACGRHTCAEVGCRKPTKPEPTFLAFSRATIARKPRADRTGQTRARVALLVANLACKVASNADRSTGHLRQRQLPRHPCRARLSAEHAD